MARFNLSGDGDGDTALASVGDKFREIKAVLEATEEAPGDPGWHGISRDLFVFIYQVIEEPDVERINDMFRESAANPCKANTMALVDYGLQEIETFEGLIGATLDALGGLGVEGIAFAEDDGDDS